jgi:short-subunit dehydrogenase
MLAEQGCGLVLTGRNATALKKLSKELSSNRIEVFSAICDVRDQVAVQELAVSIEGKFHHIDILINNAGIGHPEAPVDKLSPGVWTDVIGTNLTGMFLVTHFALPLFRRGGAIVNNLSIAARNVFPGSAAYSASKHGALGFTNTLREELRNRRIRVIALLPGATATEIWQTIWPNAPRAKMMSPETVARAVVNTLLQPIDSTIEELLIMPPDGRL